MIETEKSVSPFRMADSIGEAPRYCGRREGWMLRIPSGSNKSRRSDLMRTPKEARTPWASGAESLRFLTVSRSDFSLAWKIISKCWSRTVLVYWARGPLPKKMIFGLFIREELFIIFDFAVVVDWLEVAFVVHSEEGFFVVLDVVDEEDAAQVVDFMEQDAGEGAIGLDADFGAVFEEGFDFGLFGAGDKAVDFRNRETAFIVFFEFAFGFYDFGVDEGGKVVVLLVLHVVANDDDFLVDAHLGGGHGGRKFKGVTFFPVERELHHVGDDFFCIVGNPGDFGGFFSEARIRGSDNFHKGNYSIKMRYFEG